MADNSKEILFEEGKTTADDDNHAETNNNVRSVPNSNTHFLLSPVL